MTHSKEYANEYYRKNAEKIRPRNAAWARAHRAKTKESRLAAKMADPRMAMWRGARERAKRSGLPFDISVSDIVVPERCPVFGVPLAVARGRAQPNSPSLDRIDSAAGYVVGNVRVISKRANTIKNDATVAELALALRDAKMLAGLLGDDE